MQLKLCSEINYINAVQQCIRNILYDIPYMSLNGIHLNRTAMRKLIVVTLKIGSDEGNGTSSYVMSTFL